MEKIKETINRTKKRFKEIRQKNNVFDFIVSIQERYSQRNGNNKVGYITYYMFLSLLPLTIVGLTTIDIVLTNNEELRQKLIDSTFSAIPVVGPTLEANLSFVKGQGLTLLTTGMILLWAARGGALALQRGLTHMSTGGELEKPFISKQLKSYGALVIISVGIVTPTIIGSIFSQDLISQLIVHAISILWNTFIVYLIFKLLIDNQTIHKTGVLISGIGISIVQIISVLIMTRSLENSRPLYGTLAIVLALMLWISLQVRVLLYGAAANSLKNR